MPNSPVTFKLLGQILSRLFDHRQFTAGQIEYLVRGLDGDAGNSNLQCANFDKLLKINEKVCLMADSLNSDSFISNENLAKDSSHKLDQLIERSGDLLNIENEYKLKEAVRLGQFRAIRQAKKEQQEAIIEAKLKTLMQTLQAEEDELEKKYLKLEQNIVLNNQSNKV